MMDSEGSFSGQAAKELEEETGIKLHSSDLVNLNQECGLSPIFIVIVFCFCIIVIIIVIVIVIIIVVIILVVIIVIILVVIDSSSL